MHNLPQIAYTFEGCTHNHRSIASAAKCLRKARRNGLKAATIERKDGKPLSPSETESFINALAFGQRW